jgi:hypothetical protein
MWVHHHGMTFPWVVDGGDKTPDMEGSCEYTGHGQPNRGGTLA